MCMCSLLNLCSLKNQDALLKLTVSTLDYSRDGLARVILSKILTAGSDVRNINYCYTGRGTEACYHYTGSGPLPLRWEGPVGSHH